MVAMAFTSGRSAARRQYRRAAEAVTNKKGRLDAGVAHGMGCCQYVLHTAAERAVGEVASALAEPGEVEAQHADALARERTPDAEPRRGIPWCR
jgi:hypothetical protein